MPNAVSKNISVRQVPHTSMLMGPTIWLMPMVQNITTPSTRPMPQANRFCGAPTQSGVWWRTTQPPTIMLGANSGLMNTRMTMSSTNTITKNRVGWKLPSSMAFMNEIMAPSNSRPEAARTARSFSTRMG